MPCSPPPRHTILHTWSSKQRHGDWLSNLAMIYRRAEPSHFLSIISKQRHGDWLSHLAMIYRGAELSHFLSIISKLRHGNWLSQLVMIYEGAEPSHFLLILKKQTCGDRLSHIEMIYGEAEVPRFWSILFSIAVKVLGVQTVTVVDLELWQGRAELLVSSTSPLDLLTIKQKLPKVKYPTTTGIHLPSAIDRNVSAFISPWTRIITGKT